ncbi:MAG: DUF6132 family protein [Acidobacteriota bacterium]
MKLKKPSKKKVIRHLLFIAGGALTGFAYYYFIGCKTGTCPITSDPSISVIYGSVFGFVLSI